MIALPLRIFARKLADGVISVLCMRAGIIAKMAPRAEQLRVQSIGLNAEGYCSSVVWMKAPRAWLFQSYVEFAGY
jgi:hypothetical protein